jgi:hypothetical protein
MLYRFLLAADLYCPFMSELVEFHGAAKVSASGGNGGEIIAILYKVNSLIFQKMYSIGKFPGETYLEFYGRLIENVGKQ